MASRFESLHAWRGICALLVATLHLHTTGLINNSALVQSSYRFVDFFFVLSGFVMAITYRSRLEDRQTRIYLIRRIGRLWPLHLAVLFTMVMAAIAAGRIGLTLDGFSWAALPANIFLVHSWGFLDSLTWNGPSWSISTEIFAYFVFALVARFARGRSLDLVFGVLAMGSLAIVLRAPDGMVSTYDFGLARCIFGFFTGALAAGLWTRGRRPRGEIAALVVTVVMVIWLPMAVGALVVPVFAWVILVFASDAGPVSKLLRHALPQRLGTLSYSIYMVHNFVDLAFLVVMAKFTTMTGRPDGVFSIIGPWWVTDGLTLVYLASVIAVASLTYRWIERPGQRMFNRFE